jgi:chromosome segregation ATPase
MIAETKNHCVNETQNFIKDKLTLMNIEIKTVRQEVGALEDQFNKNMGLTEQKIGKVQKESFETVRKTEKIEAEFTKLDARIVVIEKITSLEQKNEKLEIKVAELLKEIEKYKMENAALKTEMKKQREELQKKYEQELERGITENIQKIKVELKLAISEIKSFEGKLKNDFKKHENQIESKLYELNDKFLANLQRTTFEFFDAHPKK